MNFQKIGNTLKKAIGVEGSFKDAILPMLGYNSANILFGGSGYIIALYFRSFLVEVEMLSAKQAGIIVLFAQVWDAVTDPAMGLITDRTRSKYGRHRRYMLWGVVPMAVSYFCLWNSFGLSSGDNSTVVMLYYIIAYMLFNTAYTLVCVPHTAMLPEIAPQYFLRTQYSSVGYIMNSVGMVSSFALVSITLGFINMDALTPAARPKFILLGLVLCLWFSLPLLITFFTTKEKSSLAMPVRPFNAAEFFNEYKTVFKNKAFRRYFAMSATYMVAKSFYTNTNQEFVRYVARREEKYNIIATIAGVAEASGFPVNYALTQRRGKQFCGKLLTPLMILGLAVNLFVGAKTPLFIIMLSTVLYNFGFSGPGFTVTNVQPDVTEVDEMITGMRREGVIATFSSFVKKTISGLVSGLSGIMLDSFGFTPGVTKQGLRIEQSAQTKFGLRLLYAIVPIVLTVICYIDIFRYKMTKQDHELIKRAITEKKETGKVTLTPEERSKIESLAGQKLDDMWLGRETEAIYEPELV